MYIPHQSQVTHFHVALDVFMHELIAKFCISSAVRSHYGWADAKLIW